MKSLLPMNLKNNLILGCWLLAAGSASPAQPQSIPTGVIGQPYAELSFGVQEIKFLSTENVYRPGVAANAPMIPGKLDAGGTYTYSWIGGSRHDHASTIGGYATAYTAMGKLKPFISAGLGWQWTSGTSDQGLWGAALGIEIPVGIVAITPRINYADDFERGRASSQAWTYQGEVNCWFSPKSSVFVSIGKTDLRHIPIDVWNYQVGLRGKF